MGLKNKLIEAKYFYLQNSKAYCKEEVNIFCEGEEQSKIYTIESSLKPIGKGSKVKIEVSMTLSSLFEIQDCRIMRSNNETKTSEKYKVDKETQILHYTFMHDGEKVKRDFPINESFHIATPAISTLFFMTLKEGNHNEFKLYTTKNEWEFNAPPTINNIKIDPLEQNEKFTFFEIDSVSFQTKKFQMSSFDGSLSQVIQSEFFNLPLEIQFESIIIRAQVFKVF